ncbi:MAG: CsiV family protein [Pseudomonadales bacterium]|nr:CsiV family protein [Pseudomonadales bacterium]
MPALNLSIVIKLSKLFICSFGVCYASNIIAETKKDRLPEFEDVYRIELIIFTNRNNLDAFNDNDDSQVAEDWSAIPELSYPDNLVFLHPARLEPVAVEPIENIIEISPPQREELIETIPESEILLVQEDTRTAVEKALASLPLLEYLDSETHLLNDMAKSIGRRSNHQVLFHQAWHQELGAAAIAPSIPIAGGESFDNHRELEGSIKLNKDRYLHITSDLWLTQYILRNNAQWDRLTQEATKNSLLTASIIDINPVPDFPLDLVRMAEDAAIREAALAQIIEDEALYEFTLEQGGQVSESLEIPIDMNGDVINVTDESKDLDIDSGILESDIDALVNEAEELNVDLFEASKTYVLKEHRKMKRAEVHFLDHPMMGLIIQITKYEVPVSSEGF